MTPSFPHRMVAVAARIVLAIVEDLPAAVADIACLIAMPVSLWLLHRLIVRTAATIGEHVAAHHKQAAADAVDDAFNAIVERYDATADDPMGQLDEVVRIKPQPAPLPRRQLHRRPRRFPGRRIRRHHTTSSSDRRSR
jgi:hypothetical protein